MTWVRGVGCRVIPYKFEASRVDPPTKSANCDQMRSQMGKIVKKWAKLLKIE